MRTYQEQNAPCGYIVAGSGLAARFCDAPALRGSSYCGRHRARCAVAPGSAAARGIVADLARAAKRAPVPELPALPPAPEPLEPTEPDEAMADLDREPSEREDET